MAATAPCALGATAPCALGAGLAIGAALMAACGGLLTALTMGHGLADDQQGQKEQGILKTTHDGVLTEETWK